MKPSSLYQFLLAALLGAGPTQASAAPPKQQDEAAKAAAARPKAPVKATATPRVTTGDDDDINDLEVQRKQKAAPTSQGQAPRAKAAATPRVTTGDDDDINDLEVQRKQKAAADPWAPPPLPPRPRVP